MSKAAPTRMLAILVALTMSLGSLNTAWAAPVNPPRQSTTPIAGQIVGHPVPAPLRAPNAESTRGHLVNPGLDSRAFTPEERLNLQQRQAQAQHLKQFKGGDVVIIGTTAAILILAAVLIIVLVH